MKLDRTHHAIYNLTAKGEARRSAPCFGTRALKTLGTPAVFAAGKVEERRLCSWVGVQSFSRVHRPATAHLALV